MTPECQRLPTRRRREVVGFEVVGLKSSKGPRIYNRTSHRLREIERIVRHRYGVIPDTDDADIILGEVACCYQHLLWKKFGRPTFDKLLEWLQLWCEQFGPGVSILLLREVAREVCRRPHLSTADECAERLRLTYNERTHLRITTIGSHDVDKRERAKRNKARKRKRDRVRAAGKRAMRGAVCRKQYLANSVSATQPWKAEGISRRTWERRRRATPKPLAGRLPACRMSVAHQ
jgi:hypothetical protein